MKHVMFSMIRIAVIAVLVVVISIGLVYLFETFFPEEYHKDEDPFYALMLFSMLGGMIFMLLSESWKSISNKLNRK